MFIGFYGFKKNVAQAHLAANDATDEHYKYFKTYLLQTFRTLTRTCQGSKQYQVKTALKK